MKQLMIAVVLLIVGLVGAVPQAEAVVCQNKTMIVYNNGMFNEKREAKRSLEKLESNVNAYPQVAPLLAELEYTLAYARNNNPYFDPNTGKIIGGVKGQLLEVANQIKGNRVRDFWLWLTGSSIAPPEFQDAKLRLAATANLQFYVGDADLTSQLNEVYRPALAQGKRVLTVAHSQGNLYANAAYDRLFLDGVVGLTKNHMGIVSVASPASFVNGNNGNVPHVTVFEDLIISLVATAMPATHSNRGDMNVNDPYGHSFVKYYLAGANTSAAILNHIVQTIGGLQYPSALGGGNIVLDGVLPNAFAAAALQYAVASGATAVPATRPPAVRQLEGRETSLTIQTCTGSSFSFYLLPPTWASQLENNAFLIALGYDKYRWRFGGSGLGSWAYPSKYRIDTSLSFPTLAELRAYADPRLLGFPFFRCLGPSLVESTRVTGNYTFTPTITKDIITTSYELYNPGATSRCNWDAFYQSRQYFGGFSALRDEYYTATDKQAWADGLLQKAKAYYGAQ